MTTGRNLKSILVAVVLLLGTLTAASFVSNLLGGYSLPDTHPVRALPGPPVLGIDCALGASADSPNPFPTAIATKDSDGVIDSSCLWTGDFDGDTHTPFPTFDPLVSDSPEVASAGLGGGFMANVRYTNGNNTVNAFDISVGYNPAVLDFVQFDQSGLLFGGNVGCPITNPNCTLGLSNLVDRTNGVVRLAQAIEGITTGGSPNSVTLFRMRFDVVGSGSSALTFGASSPSVPSKNIVTFVIPPNITGPEVHSTLNSAFDTASIFQLTNGVAAGSFNASWTFSPNPEVPFAPLTLSATTAACNYPCTLPFTYQWDFSSFDSSGYVTKVNATGQTVTVTAPPQAINRVTLTVTDSAAHSVTAVRRLPLVGATQGPANAVVGTASAPFKSGYLGGVSAECSGASCSGTGSTGFSGTWRMCPGSAFLKTACSNPNAAASADPASIAGIIWIFAGLYNTVFSVSDSSPSQVGGPQTVAKTFPVNVTGATPAFTVSVAADKTSVQAGSPVTITPTTAYTASYPLSFQSTLFSYDFNWGDGTPDNIVSAGTTTSQSHTYLAGGSFIVRVAVQETGAAAPTSIVENGFSPTINVAGPFNFQVSVAPTGATVAAGSGTSATVMATLLSGTTQSVSFSATGQPAGSTVTFLPTSCSPTCTSQMSITTSASTPPGTFPITITGTATGGLATMTTFTLIVIPPVVFAVTISCPLTGSVGTAVACTASSSGGTGTVTFAWTATGGSPASGTGSSFSPIYSVKGTVSISVTGTDSATPTPHTNTATANVMITPLALTVTPTVPATGTVGTGVSVSATPSGGTSPYMFSWDFGDGTAAVSGATASHTYTAKGSFTVKVTVTDANTVTATNTATITISALALATDFTFPATITPNTPVTFTATTSGGTTPYAYAWTFGDGTTGTGNPVGHAYSSSGPFTVTETVTDANTKTATAAHSVGSVTPFTVTIACPGTHTVGTAVFCAVTTSGGIGTVTFSWTATGGNPSSGTGTSFSTTYSVKGTFSISVTGTDSATPTPNTQTKSASVMIGALPVAIVQTVPTTGTVNAPVSVSASASGGTSPYVFSWSFGDGTANVLGATPSHNYATKGTFTVKVNATDTNGVIVSASSTILISALPVTVTPTVPTGGTVGTSVSVSAIASGGTSPYAFSWSFGDGSAKVTGATATHTYTAKGTFTVKVNATDNNGVIGSNSAMITIAALTLTTDFSISPTTVTANTPIVFTATTSGGTTPYGYAWAFGDGTTGSTNPVTHTYSTTGPFIVGLTVTDSNTKTATATHTIGSAPPFTVTISCPSTGTVGAMVNCTVTATGGTTPYTFAWTATGGTPASATGTSFSTTYSVKGMKTISVTGTDSATPTAATDTKSATVNISPLALTTDFTFPTTITPGTAVTFTATTSGGTTPYTYAWTFGDGTAGTGNPGSHTYSSTGPFTVVLTVTDGNAATATATHTVGQAAAFTVTINCPATGTVGTAVPCTASSSGGTGTVTFSWMATGGNPSSGTGASFSPIYSVKGTVSISVTGTDSATPTANVQTKFASVVISPLSLVPSISGPSTGTVGQALTFSGSATGGTAPYTIAWTALGGSPVVDTAPTFTTMFSTKGTFVVNITATDANGQRAATQTSVTISALSLTTDFTISPTTITANSPVTFTATTSGGTAGYTYSWDFGDTSTGSGNPISHTYSTTGPFTVTVTATDSNGKTATATHTIGSVAALSVTINCPASGTVGIAVNCTATSTGGTAPVTFAWTATGGTPSSGTGASFTTTYSVKGTVSISVTGTDSATPTANTQTRSASITIAAVALSADFTFSPANPTNATLVSFTATVSGGTAPYTYAWSFGDTSTGTGNPATHTYATPGTFSVMLTVTDMNGVSTTATHTVAVTSTVTGQAVLLTFQGFNIDDCDNGVGQLNVIVNGQMVANLPPCTVSNGDNPGFANKFVSFGPFDITSFVVQGQNTIVFSSPPPGHFGLIKNVTITQGDTLLLHVSGTRFVALFHPVKFTLSNPPLVLTMFTAVPSTVSQGQPVTFTATFTGGAAPFACFFNFGDGEGMRVNTTGLTCTATHDYDSGGVFTATVLIRGASTSDLVTGSTTVTVQDQQSALQLSYVILASSKEED